MHEDICSSAALKHVALIILPFHKHQRIDGQLDLTREDLRNVNKRVLKHAPCSVGILVDRGLGGISQASASDVNYTITVFFFGGADDGEALAYGTLMAEHPGIRLNAIHFVPDPSIATGNEQLDIKEEPIKKSVLDEELLRDLQDKIQDEDSVHYQEIRVSNYDTLIEAISIYNRSNLLLVGRMSEGVVAQMLNSRMECPELGPVGNLLISPDIKTTASLLVLQKYRAKLTDES